MTKTEQAVVDAAMELYRSSAALNNHRCAVYNREKLLEHSEDLAVELAWKQADVVFAEACTAHAASCPECNGQGSPNDAGGICPVCK